MIEGRIECLARGRIDGLDLDRPNTSFQSCAGGGTVPSKSQAGISAAKFFRAPPTLTAERPTFTRIGSLGFLNPTLGGHPLARPLAAARPPCRPPRSPRNRVAGKTRPRRNRSCRPPNPAAAITAHHGVFLDHHAAFARLVGDAASQVDQQAHRLVAGKGVLVEPSVGGRRQFDLHLGILQDDAVVARPGDFILVRKGAKVSFLVCGGGWGRAA